MIIQINEPFSIEPIIKLILEKKETFTIEPEKLVSYFLSAIKDKNSIVLVDEKDKEIKGFLFASVEELDGRDVCFIHTCLIDKKSPYTGFEFLSRLEKFCKERKLGEIDFITQRSKDGFEKKYKFKEKGILLTKEVKYE